MDSYWALRTFTRFGSVVAVAGGCAIPLLAAAAMLACGKMSWAIMAATIIAGGVAGFFLKVFSDLAQVIVEMLLPNTN